MNTFLIIYFTLQETISEFGNAFGGWYGDDSAISYPDHPFLRRGGERARGTWSGIFGYLIWDGSQNTDGSFRVVLTAQDGNS